MDLRCLIPFLFRCNAAEYRIFSATCLQTFIKNVIQPEDYNLSLISRIPMGHYQSRSYIEIKYSSNTVYADEENAFLTETWEIQSTTDNAYHKIQELCFWLLLQEEKRWRQTEDLIQTSSMLRLRGETIYFHHQLQMFANVTFMR